MKALEKRGLRNITAKRPRPGPRANWIVRIYYRSMGDEVLCCDSDLLSRVRAESLVGSIGFSLYADGSVMPKDKARPTDVLDVEVLRFDYCGPTKHGARRVILPHRLAELPVAP